MALNKAWHDKNRMPKRPTRAERLAWHFEHALHCGCREIPQSLKTEVRRLLGAHARPECARSRKH